MLGGQVGVAGHLRWVAPRSRRQAGITFTLPAESYVAGSPPLPLNLDRRIHVLNSACPTSSTGSTRSKRNCRVQKNLPLGDKLPTILSTI